MNRTKFSKIGFVLGAALVGTLTGCVGYVDGPRHGTVHVQPPSVHVDAGIMVQADYVYYPAYQVYYSRSASHYVYRDGRSWVSRPAPPRVSVDVLFASPSVTLDFRDSPAVHHTTVVRQYPRNWKPPGGNRGNNDGDRGNRGNSGNRGNRGRGNGGDRNDRQ